MSSPGSARIAACVQPLRFLLVGVANTLAGLTVVYLAKLLLGFGDFTANASGYACGLAIGYLLNSTWTFDYRGRNAAAICRFLLAFLAAYAANLLTVWTAIHHLHLNGYLAQALGILPYTICFFLLSKLFVFRVPRRREEVTAAPMAQG
jgi:putative flippase GtrA